MEKFATTNSRGNKQNNGRVSNSKSTAHPKPHRKSVKQTLKNLPQAQSLHAKNLLRKLSDEIKALGGDGIIRDDSQLAIALITNRLDKKQWNLRTVATELYRTSRLHQQTNFEQVSARVIEIVQNECSAMVPEEDLPSANRAVVQFLLPPLKNIFMHILNSMDTQNFHADLVRADKLHDQQVKQSLTPTSENANFVVDLSDENDDSDDEDGEIIESDSHQTVKPEASLSDCSE